MDKSKLDIHQSTSTYQGIKSWLGLASPTLRDELLLSTTIAILSTSGVKRNSLQPCAGFN
jgi:hypothetical protein